MPPAIPIEIRKHNVFTDLKKKKLSEFIRLESQ